MISPRVALVAVLVISALGAFFSDIPKLRESPELITLVGPQPDSRPSPLAGPALFGPGVIVTLKDSPRQPGPSEDAYFFIIHDADLTTLVTELSACGAEAIAVNDHRVVFPGSSLRCVGPCITLDGHQLRQPYVVKAIGSPRELEAALRCPNGFFDSMAMLTRFCGSVEVVQSSDVSVPELRSAGYRYATPIP